MKIGGLTKTTLLDYPGNVAAAIFTHGCNFRCPFCHNGDLVIGNITDSDLIAEEEIIDFLAKRKNVLTGLCISGGEPTIQPDLADFIRMVKKMGYLVKLDTNGYRPEVLENLIKEKLLDYIAMDIKNTKEKYNLTCDLKDISFEKIETSVELIKKSGLYHEFRTTVVKELHTIDDLISIGRRLSSNDWYLQPFEANDKVLKEGYSSYTEIEITAFSEILQAQGIAVKVRAV
ncbi:MAG: anaerobic ribonucleoside-triphosphate reductase activating protein [Lachnospiraceae bacterium]|nr:anaerobic ribonucleoside-triphosphate reductase activating protein [Lachnospiraceae bacterium]